MMTRAARRGCRGGPDPDGPGQHDSSAPGREESLAALQQPGQSAELGESSILDRGTTAARRGAQHRRGRLVLAGRAARRAAARTRTPDSSSGSPAPARRPRQPDGQGRLRMEETARPPGCSRRRSGRRRRGRRPGPTSRSGSPGSVGCFEAQLKDPEARFELEVTLRGEEPRRGALISDAIDERRPGSDPEPGRGGEHRL